MWFLENTGRESDAARVTARVVLPAPGAPEIMLKWRPPRGLVKGMAKLEA